MSKRNKFLITSIILGIILTGIFTSALCAYDFICSQTPNLHANMKSAVLISVICTFMYDIHEHIRHNDDDDPPINPSDSLVVE